MNDSPRRRPRGWRKGGILLSAEAICRKTAGDLQIPMWSFVYQGDQVKGVPM